jgi:xanthine dehydrogenase accessory factor
MSDPLKLPDSRAAVATLIATEGSTPKDAGAKMWVDEHGHVLGSVTIGGCVDARVIEESSRVLDSGQPTLLTMSLGDEDAWALGMTCGGSVDVLIEPVEPARDDDPVASMLRAAAAEVRSGHRCVIVAPLAGTERLLVKDHGHASGTLGDVALDRVARVEASRVLEGGVSGVRAVDVEGVSHRLYFERHAPPLTVVVFGATHVAISLVTIAQTLGMRVVVVDARDRFATRERFPTADELIVGMPSEIAERMPLGPTSLVVLLSHDYKFDLPVLRAVLASEAAYVGLLGSARRGRAILEFLRDDGVPAAQLARVRVPVGLDIGARTTEEIALSVLAEALAVYRGRGGGPMRDRPPRDTPAA